MRRRPGACSSALAHNNALLMPAARRPVAAFLIALLALGVVITTDVVPGVFIVDDNNYLINVVALREGRVTVPQTDGLPPSAELLFFDPGHWMRTVTSTPVASTAPPLYAPVALQFSFFGRLGLWDLNTLEFLATTLMVFLFPRRRSKRERTASLAAVAFALGGFAIEYAEGVWPHMLSVALCTGGIIAAARVLDRGEHRLAAIAGGLLAVAAGIRYQNAVVLGAVGLGLILWRVHWRALTAFSGAAILPLLVSSLFNYARFGSWNPVSKGPGYMQLQGLATPDGHWWDPVVMGWAK